MKLSFLIVGVQKGATSALHYFLRQHPSLYLPEKKELHFFDNEKIDWLAPHYDEADLTRTQELIDCKIEPEFV